MKEIWSDDPIKLNILLKNFADILWEYDCAELTFYPDPKMAEFYGLPASITGGAQGLCDFGILHPDSIFCIAEILHGLSTEEGTLTAEILARLSSSGDYRWYSTMFTSYWEEDSKIPQIIGLFQDITPQVQMRLHLQHLANTDSLTGVYNTSAARQLIQNQLLQQSPEGRNIMMLFDLDNFKQINDLYGHYCGDKLLKNFARILQKACRQTDIVYRIGGDEFGIFAFHTCDYSLITRICNEVLSQTAGLCVTPEPISVSIGAAVNRIPVRSYSDYYRTADRAMYQAKAMGKGRYTTIYF